MGKLFYSNGKNKESIWVKKYEECFEINKGQAMG